MPRCCFDIKSLPLVMACRLKIKLPQEFVTNNSYFWPIKIAGRTRDGRAKDAVAGGNFSRHVQSVPVLKLAQPMYRGVRRRALPQVGLRGASLLINCD
jgi:hypothetical protein